MLRLSPDAVRRPSTGKDLQPDGGGLASVLANLALTARARLADIEGGLAQLTQGRVVGVATPDAGNGAYNLELVMASGVRVAASLVSTGVLYLLYVLTLVQSDSPPRIILMEEPENSVHPARLRELVELLRGLTVDRPGRPACQLLVATHSPYLLDACKPEEVLVFQREGPGGWTTIRRPPADIDKKSLGLLLGELWGSYGESGLIEGAPTRALPTAEVKG